MKTWVKVAIGTLIGAAAGIAASFLGKKHEDGEDLLVDDAEDYDSDSDEEAE